MRPSPNGRRSGQIATENPQTGSAGRGAPARIVHRDLKPANVMLTKNGVRSWRAHWPVAPPRRRPVVPLT